MGLLSKEGVDADVRNLGVGGSTFPMTFFILKTAMKAIPHPDLVILNITPMFFKEDVRNDICSAQQQADEAFSRSYIGQCVATRPKDIYKKLDCGLQRVSYLYRHRAMFKEQIQSLPGRIANPEQFSHSNVMRIRKRKCPLSAELQVMKS